MSHRADPFAPPRPHTAERRLRWRGLLPGADALALAAAARAQDALVLVVTADTESANRLESELAFFLSQPSDPQVLHFPDWETLAYDSFSPHEAIISQRLATLAALPSLRRGVLVSPITTLLHRISPLNWLLGRTLALSKGDQFDRDESLKRFHAAGYRRVDTVLEHGEYAVRGALIDIFPMGSAYPFRIDLFDDEIESLRTFDPESQRTLETLDTLRLLPAKEFPLDETALKSFKDRWHLAFDVDARACPIYQDVTQGSAPAGIEYYLPLFFDALDSLPSYLPEGTLVAFLQGTAPAAEAFRQEVDGRFENLRYDPQRPILPPDTLFQSADELFEQLGRFGQLRLSSDAGDGFDFAVRPLPDLSYSEDGQARLDRLKTFLAGDDAPKRVLICAESAGRRELLRETLARGGLAVSAVSDLEAFFADGPSLGLTLAPLFHGFHLPAQKLAVITEADLLGERVQQSRRRKKGAGDAPELIFRSLSELTPGAPVVHNEHGVGRYLGLETMALDDGAQEFLTLEYAGGSKLYVPVANMHLISRYSGADETHAPLHRLGSEQWEKARRKAAEKVRDVAAELLDIYARRELRPGHAFPAPDADYERFAGAFPFEETDDQERAIDAVLEDMTAARAMDRLVCGDVGFGKTEVAMRAAYLAVAGGRQVAVLVPTTLLAQQHVETFSDRFADWPVRVEVLSRFRSASEVKAVAERLKAGKIDILVGTHKLLSKEIEYARLGLIIIDEEHRFGVRQKEQLRALRAEVDVLTLTATPIPRTLNMSMHGLRDLSIIATPPQQRLSIKTFVREASDGLVKEAVLRELLRGGQVFFVHNEVRTIEQTAERLRALIPEARVAVGHGQMRERELEQVMSDFYHRRANVLLCSTIIETGIDIPNANTIIIERADRFGLAQLHQLRGRVGRSNRQAYAYLLTPHVKAMTADAQKRLEAIEAAGDLGAGFSLATHDLEIRGAGELLGDEQSGQIEAIGFTLYMDMLERATAALRAGKEANLDAPLGAGVEVDLHLPALIPDDYLPDVHARLIAYRQIASAEDEEALKDVQRSMIDRFGLLPPPLKTLFEVTGLKLKAEALGVTRVNAGAENGRLDFAQEPTLDPMALITLVQQSPNRYRLEGGQRLRFRLPMATPEQRMQTVEGLLDALAKPAEHRG
ncbi:MAG: transcription-repair coupling factor [Pseudomonadales bacterium]|nr:transcription-repair coupling factor [Pseudomonadales bacterium]